MLTRALGALVLSAGLVVLPGCYGGGEAESEMGEGEMGEAETGGAMAQAVPLPDTTAASLWDYLQSVDYRSNWELWPGKGEKYKGQVPHGMLLTTYLNPAALEALTGMAGSMPEGAIIVKENYMPDSTLAAVTTMYKVTGFNPEHNDWFFAKQQPDGTVEVEGRGPGCQACHSQRAENDYIFTGSLK